MNDHVAREIRSLQTVERNFFIDSYYRSGMYRPHIVAQMKKAGLPEDLSWLPLIESGFKVKALSRARALGLWQFIASTGYRFDLRRDRWVDERMDLERSTDAAINYLTTLHDLFGDWTTVLAAYNCGEANVLRVIRQQHVNYLDNFWDLYTRLPAETARYVPGSLHRFTSSRSGQVRLHRVAGCSAALLSEGADQQAGAPPGHRSGPECPDGGDP